MAVRLARKCCQKLRGPQLEACDDPFIEAGGAAGARAPAADGGSSASLSFSLGAARTLVRGPWKERHTRFQEVVSCSASQGDEGGTWHAGELTVTDAGISFQPSASSAGPEAAAAAGAQVEVSWGDVAAVAPGGPWEGGGQEGPAAAEGQPRPWLGWLLGCPCRSRHRPGPLSYELELRRPPGRLRLRFAPTEQPARRLEALWEARGGAAPPGAAAEADAAAAAAAAAPSDGEERAAAEMRALLLGGGVAATRSLTMHSLNKSPLDGPATRGSQARVREEIMRTDEHGIIQQTWREAGGSQLELRQWEPCPGGGVMLTVTMMLRLKPRPMAPKQTRVVLVYHLPDESEGDLVLTELSRSLDVPYKDSFEVWAQQTFSITDGTLAIATSLGVRWRGRCMVKSLVEKASREEGGENHHRWAAKANAALTQPAV